MRTTPKKRYPVIWGLDGYILGYATTAEGALRKLRKLSTFATGAKLNRAKKRAWIATYD